MPESRRSFLKKTGVAALGAGCGWPLLKVLGRTLDEGAGAVAPETKQLAMVIDLEKVRNIPALREACAEACHREHNVPTGIEDPDEEVKWIWTEEHTHAFPDQVHDQMPEKLRTAPVLVLCNHCTNPPCVRVCPTQATWRRESDGIVMMDMHRCIGCRYCIAACPYGSRSFNWKDPRPHIPKDGDGKYPSSFPTRSAGVVEKCNFCAERLRKNEEPACVVAARKVTQGALTFGDRADPKSEVSVLLENRRTICRRPSIGTGPNVYYIL
jgi:molybdopterin-containing oxidoreductase family iron-sulfur binding subunit